MKTTRGFPGSYRAFEERLSNLGWEKLPRVSTPKVIGLTFWGHSHYVDREQYRKLRHALWSALCPSIPEDFRDFVAAKGLPRETAITAPELSAWRNWWCDVHSAYAHIHSKRDLFVTTNSKDFQRNSAALEALGLVAVTPDDALTEVSRGNYGTLPGRPPVVREE